MLVGAKLKKKRKYWHTYCRQPKHSFISFVNLCYIFRYSRPSQAFKTHNLKPNKTGDICTT